MEHTLPKLDQSHRFAHAAGLRIWIASSTAWRRLCECGGINLAIAAFCLVFIAAVWIAVVSQTQSDRAETIANAFTQNSNLAMAFEEHTIRTIKGVDAAALFIANEYARLGTKINVAKYIEDGLIDGKLFINVAVADERGFMIANDKPFIEGLNLSEREHFKVHVQSDGGNLHIGKPVISNTTKKWSIQMTRRINKPDGSFGGVVSIAVDPAYFTNFYSQTVLGKEGLVMLTGLDGISRARYSGGKTSFGKDLSTSPLFKEQLGRIAGTFSTTGKVENVPRYVSYRTLIEYPLIVSVGTSQEEVLAEFLRTQKYDYYAALLFTAVIVSFAVLMIAALTRQKRAVTALLGSEVQFRATFEQAAVGIVHTTFDRRYLQVNQKFCDMLGYTRDELLAMRSNEISHPDDRELGTDINRALAGEMHSYSGEKRYIRKDGSVFWAFRTVSLARDSAGKPLYFIRVVEDITERKQLQQDLQHLAHHDKLTRLPNRELFYDRLEHALGQAQRRSWITGIMFIDLDGFKKVNDTLGHGVGDQLLQQVSARLTECVRTDDTIGRLGGDEFAVILSELAREQDGGLVAQKIIDALAKPFLIDGHEILISASIGVTTCPPDGGGADVLVNNADAAMYSAKRLGKNNYQYYTAVMNDRAKENLLLEQDLRHALPRDEFVLHFQPKASLRTGMITSVEALLRWQRPGKGLVSPMEFIPLLEESGLIVPVGEWVLRTACAQIRTWQEDGLTPVPIAVNLSAKQFHQQDICAMVTNALRDHAIEPRYLELEITESAAMHNAKATTATLRKLKALGVRIAIDDFGTGYSSLSYLKRFPIDSLKIDRSFITDLPGNQDDASIAQAVMTMAHALRLTVVAEGVETVEQLEFLSAYGCDEMQGYYFSKPLSADDCTRFLRDDKRLPQRSAAKHDTECPAILLVDDDPDTLLLFKRIFRSKDYEVLTAGNVHEGLKLLKERNVKVVISDQQMPGMSGIDFLRRVKSLSPHAVRLMLSGNTESKTVSDAVKEGEVHRLLDKNRDNDQLRRDIQAAYRVATSGHRGQLIPIHGGRAARGDAGGRFDAGSLSSTTPMSSSNDVESSPSAVRSLRL